MADRTILTPDQLQAEMFEAINKVSETPITEEKFDEWLKARNFGELCKVWKASDYYKLYTPMLYDQRGGVKTTDTLKFFTLNTGGYGSKMVSKYKKEGGYPVSCYLSIHDALHYDDDANDESELKAALSGGEDTDDDYLWAEMIGYIPTEADTRPIYRLVRVGSSAGLIFTNIHNMIWYLGVEDEAIEELLEGVGNNEPKSFGPYRVTVFTNSGLGD